MSYPCDPPPYSDKNPLIPLQPEDYSQLGPSAVEYLQPPGYPQPGGNPGASVQPAACAGGYLVPGGYAPSAGYPQPKGPEAPRPVLPMHLGDTSLPTGNSYIVTSLRDDVVRTVDWDDKRVRHTFICKVYTIISVQLLVTVGIIAVFTFVSPVRTFVQRNVAVYYSSYAVFLVTYLGLACCQGPRRRFPWNLILLSVFTLAMAFMTGTIASMYNTRAVLITMVITAKVAIIVTVFCFQTKVDFTSCTGLFCVLGIVVVQTSIVTAIVLYYKYIQWVHMVFTAMAAIAFTLFLAYDTQLLVGNKQYGLSPEEYIFGALEIYVDIVYIFLFLLRFLGWKYSLQQGSWLAQPGAEEHSGKTSLPSCFCSFLPPYPSVCLPANGLWFPPFPVEPSVGFPQSVPRVVAGETVPWKSPIMRLCPAMTPELADLCLPR